mgnify:CR=1 FL=1
MIRWIKNPGNTFKPPTDKIVHLLLSTNEQHNIGERDIWYNQDPHKWDWLKQSGVEITHYSIADEERE